MNRRIAIGAALVAVCALGILAAAGATPEAKVKPKKATTAKATTAKATTAKATTAKTTTAAATTTAKSPTATPLPAPNDTAWLSFGNDDQSTKGVVSAAITAATVGNLHPRWTVKLAGQVVAQPLYYQGLVYVASEGGDLLAVNASTGAVVWKKTSSVVKTPSCGTWGISATPVIDIGRHRIYVAQANGQINGYDLTSGGQIAGFPVSVVSSSVMEYVWGGLRIYGNRVLAGISSHCDEPNTNGAYATGKLVGVNLDNTTDKIFFQPVTGSGHLGGIWGYSGATVQPGGGSVFTATGNAIGTDPACKCQHDDWGYGDAIVQLDANLKVLAANNPGIPKAGDDDWGAAPALFQPQGCQPLAVAENKNGLIYVYNQNSLTSGPIWSLGIGDGASPLLDSPAWSSYEQMFYVAGARMPYDRSQPRTGEGIIAIKVGPGCTFSVAWTAPTGDGPQAPPIVVGNVVFASGSNHNVVALDAATGKQLWIDTTQGTTLGAPSEAAGTLFAPDGSTVTAFGP